VYLFLTFNVFIAMTVTLSQSQLNWVNLPSDQKDMFNNIAAKDGDLSMDGYDWFDHLVPDELQDSAQEVEVFMNGGTVTREEWVYDQGRGSGHYETVDYEISDKDVSRVQSGHNGGEYTSDNTIMEDSSINRARGADNMTAEELDTAQAAVETDISLIDGADVATEQLTTTAAESTVELTDAGTSLAGEAVGVVAEVAIAGIAAVKVGSYVYDNLPSDWEKDDKVLATASAGLGTAFAACTPPGQALIAVYAGYKLFHLGWKACVWLSDYANKPSQA
jgi:hypothetical protein